MSQSSPSLSSPSLRRTGLVPEHEFFRGLERGPLSAWVIERLHGRTREMPVVTIGDGLSDDAQLALYLAYEGHFARLPGVDDRGEWDPLLLEFRSRLERAFERALRALAGPRRSGGPVGDEITRLIEADNARSLSSHMEHTGTLAEMRDIVMFRSAYQLKEGDAHTFGVPRLRGRAKQLLVAIQAGEFGADAPGREIHATLFARTMMALGLDPSPSAYVRELPAGALVISNLISMLGLHRRLRGALVGHLTVFEMTSVVPMGRYARGLARLGAPPAAARFYEVHTLADAEHEHMALAMATALAEDEPELRDDIVFGAQCALVAEAMFADALFDRWAVRDAVPVLV